MSATITPDTQVVTFDYATWALRFPELASTVPDNLAQLYFTEACTLCDNTGCGPIRDLNVLTLALNLLTAHIAFLNAPGANGQPNPTLVGRISNAGEGSVSVGTDYRGASAGQEYYSQTKYGAQYWQMTAQYRTMRYFPGPQPFFQPPFRYGMIRRW